MPSHWSTDEFTQPEVDYTGGSNVKEATKKRPKRSREARNKQRARWRAKYRRRYNNRMAAYMAERRKNLAEAKLMAAADPED